MKYTAAYMLQIVPVSSIIGIIKRNSRTVFVLLLGIILVDSFFISLSSDIVIFGVLVLYGFLARVGNMKSRETFLLSLGLFGTMMLSFVFSFASIPTEKMTVWLYLFLIVGIIQRWRE